MKAKRILSLLLILTMLLTCLTGCAKTTEADNAGGVNGSGNAGGTHSEDGSGDGSGSTPQQTDGATAMGRYVEEITDLSDSLSHYGNRLFKLADGRLVITDLYKPFLISDDNGATWKEDNREWRTRMIDENTYILDIAIGADNTVAVIFNDDSAADADDDISAEETEDESETLTESEGEEAGDDEFIWNPRLMVIRPDGSEALIDIPLTADESSPRNAGIADNGRIFVNAIGGSSLYEVKEDGSCEHFLTVQNDYPELMQFQGSLMFLDGYGYGCPLIYDMEKKEYIEDEVLAGFLRENYPDGNSYSGSQTYEMFFFTGEEGVIYIAGKKGLHRHVLGGSAVEQLIDGSLCTFNNPAYAISGMLMLENNEFLALFSEGRLVRYVYDPDMATAPSDRLKIYSLKENDTIRQAIAQYQTDYPEIAVEYEVGMEEGSAATREDALKSLNTKIMSGEGPDVLILDDMPINSYIEKGLLLDLSAIIGSLSGEDEIFGNIADAMKKDDKVYAMPCEIQLPVVAAEEKYISQLKDLKSTADVFEQLRADNPGKEIVRIYSERGILRFYAMTCVPAWTTADGKLDKEAVKEFLTYTKRIYDANIDGVPEKTIEQYRRSNESGLQESGESREDSKYFRTMTTEIFYVAGMTQLECEALSWSRAYDSLISINKVKNFENTKWTVMNGQSSNVFCAKTLLGINAASKNAAPAEDFIRLCLGKENQSNLYDGLAVNKAAFEESFIIDESMLGEDGAYSWESMSDNDGLRLDFITYQSTESQIAELMKCIEAADTPYIEDTVLEEAVYKEGVAYMQGAQSLEEAVSAIEKKISIYMAE